MAWTVPTPADLKTALPAYAAVADATVQMALDRHGEQVDDSWPDQAQFTAGAILYAAHILFMSGLGPGATSAERGSLDVKSQQAGDRKIEYFSIKDQGGGANWLTFSPSGRELAAMQRRLFGGPRVYGGPVGGFGWGCW